MSSSIPEFGVRAKDLEVTDEHLVVELEDGRRLLVPLSWFPRLMGATREQRRNWRFIGQGIGFHWPDVDEDVSVKGLLQGSGGSALPRTTR